TEFADLLSAARREGAAAAERNLADGQAERLELVSGKLNAALGALMKLAEQIDRGYLPEEKIPELGGYVTAACRHILEGQGDLFADQ
ncbi:MAG: hypothetical protein AAGJ50_13110, partial [Pseudomonadota bacterium]